MVDFKGTFQGVSDFLRSQDTGGVSLNPPLTQTASSHAVTIRSNKGIKIGRIQSWSPQISRNIETVYEVQQLAVGEPIERVPQNQTGNRVSVERYELYTFLLGEAFGVPISANKAVANAIDLYSLSLQSKPFNVREVWRDPFGSLRAYLYAGCWFADSGYTISATDDRIIKARGTIEFTRRLRLA
jgi:hypothetical protein